MSDYAALARVIILTRALRGAGCDITRIRVLGYTRRTTATTTITTTTTTPNGENS